MWYDNNPELMSVMLGDYFDMPVFYLNGKHYAAPVLDFELPIAVVIEVTDTVTLRLGDFYAIDWYSQRLERITPIRPLAFVLRELRGNEVFDLTDTSTRFDLDTCRRYLAPIFVEKEITQAEEGRPHADELFTLVQAAGVIDVECLRDYAENTAVVVPDSEKVEDYREAFVELATAFTLKFAYDS